MPNISQLLLRTPPKQVEPLLLGALRERPPPPHPIYFQDVRVPRRSVIIIILLGQLAPASSLKEVMDAAQTNHTAQSKVSKLIPPSFADNGGLLRRDELGKEPRALSFHVGHHGK